MYKYVTLGFIEKNFDKLEKSADGFGFNNGTPEEIYNCFEDTVIEEARGWGDDIDELMMPVVVLHKIVEDHNWFFGGDPENAELLELEMEESVFKVLNIVDEYKATNGAYNGITGGARLDD